jgi:hypothetical protein
MVTYQKYHILVFSKLRLHRLKIANFHLYRLRLARREGIAATKGNIDTNTRNLSHCMELVTKWHALQSDFEEKLYSLTQDERIRDGQSGSHKVEYFKGHYCAGEGVRVTETFR